MDQDRRNNIENYIDMLREELIQEIQGMNRESLIDAPSNLVLTAYDGQFSENACCSQTGGGSSK